MARLILHIGTHKTASTTIQQVFATHREGFRRHGLIYPRMGAAQGHHGLVADWVSLPPAFTYAGGSAAAWQALARRYAASDHTILLSTEELSRGQPCMQPDLPAIRRWASAFEEVRIVCLLRDQPSFLQSVYLELAKKQAPPYWAEFLQSALRTGFAAGLHLDYAALDRRLCAAFGADAVRYVDYAAACDGGDIVERFLQAAGCDPTLPRKLGIGPVRANVSPEPLVAWVASMVARPEAACADLLHTVRAAMEAAPGCNRPTTLYTGAEEERMYDNARRWNESFHDRLAARQPGFAVSLPPPDRAATRRDTLGPAFWIALARAMRGTLPAETRLAG